MLLGARIMQVEAGAGTDAHCELSGAIYPFSKLSQALVLAREGRVLTGAAELELHDDSRRDLVEMEVARAWLDQWFEPAPIPQIHHASTGEPILLVIDHHRVHDAAALAESLAAQADVDGNPEQGWNRMTQGADGAQRSLTSINPGREGGRIELFHRTQRLADEGRAWFETLAGAAVQHLTREITDPAGHLSRTGSPDGARAPGFGGPAAGSDGAGHRASPPPPLRQLGRRDHSSDAPRARSGLEPAARWCTG
jgi:hypothetical protein